MSIKVVPVTAGTNNLQTTAEESSRLLSWQFTEGVPQVGSIGIAAPHTGDFATQSNSNATVKIKAGKMIVKATPTDGVEGLFLVTLSADTNITIAENSTGSTRYDKIYIHLDADTLANPPADGDFTEALALKTQRDAASGAALTDTNSMLLCEITVATGFPTSPTEITNANIWDRRILSKLAATAPEWSPFNAVLTRASDTTATLVGDWTNRINIGNCLRWYSNTTLRQNYIVGVSYDAGTGLTTITITSGYITTANDSRFEENQLIQFAQYSKASSPVGFPDINLWIAPTLLNSWVNLAGYETAGYMKDSLGFVHLKGVIGGGANGANSVFTLPEGYRPAARKSFAASYDTGSTRLDILSDGKIYVVPANSNVLVGLSGIMFKAEV
jgi:hypothetical protein